jgi:hypothetical protein
MRWVDADDEAARLPSIPDRLNERHFCSRAARISNCAFRPWRILGGAKELRPSLRLLLQSTTITVEADCCAVRYGRYGVCVVSGMVQRAGRVLDGGARDANCAEDDQPYIRQLSIVLPLVISDHARRGLLLRAGDRESHRTSTFELLSRQAPPTATTTSRTSRVQFLTVVVTAAASAAAARALCPLLHHALHCVSIDRQDTVAIHVTRFVAEG